MNTTTTFGIQTVQFDELVVGDIVVGFGTLVSITPHLFEDRTGRWSIPGVHPLGSHCFNLGAVNILPR